MEERGEEYKITIEYDEFITRLDLDEIIQAIDRFIEAEIHGYPNDFFPFPARYFDGYPYWESGKPIFTYVGIKSITPGSLILISIIGGAVLGYSAARFKKGVDESVLADELQRSGRLTGNAIGPALKRFNDWVEKKYMPKQKELGGRVTKVVVERNKDDDKRNKKS